MNICQNENCPTRVRHGHDRPQNWQNTPKHQKTPPMAFKRPITIFKPFYNPITITITISITSPYNHVNLFPNHIY